MAAYFPVSSRLSASAFRALAYLVVIASVLGGMYAWGRSNGVESMQPPLNAEKAAHAQDLAEHAVVMRQHAERAAQVADLARSAQTVFIADRMAAKRKHTQELSDALARKNRTIAGLRAGALQLQPWWECPSVLPTASGVIGAGPTAGGPGLDAGAELRAAGHAENLYQFARADTWIRNLQAELIATRRACAVPAGLAR
jgi:hypothetical protein